MFYEQFCNQKKTCLSILCPYLKMLTSLFRVPNWVEVSYIYLHVVWWFIKSIISIFKMGQDFACNSEISDITYK